MEILKKKSMLKEMLKFEIWWRNGVWHHIDNIINPQQNE
jgi:hypothetical protein